MRDIPKSVFCRALRLPVLFRADEDGLPVADQAGDVVPDGPGEQVAALDFTDVDPLEADLEAVGLRGGLLGLRAQLAEEDEVDLVGVGVVPAHADALVDAGEAQRHHRIAGLLQQFAPDGLAEHLAGVLPAAGQSVVFPEFGYAAVDQDLALVQYDGLRRIAHGQPRSPPSSLLPLL